MPAFCLPAWPCLPMPACSRSAYACPCCLLPAACRPVQLVLPGVAPWRHAGKHHQDNPTPPLPLLPPPLLALLLLQRSRRLLRSRATACPATPPSPCAHPAASYCCRSRCWPLLLEHSASALPSSALHASPSRRRYRQRRAGSQAAAASQQRPPPLPPAARRTECGRMRSQSWILLALVQPAFCYSIARPG